jgi:hypothetical protein
VNYNFDITKTDNSICNMWIETGLNDLAAGCNPYLQCSDAKDFILVSNL